MSEAGDLQLRISALETRLLEMSVQVARLQAAVIGEPGIASNQTQPVADVTSCLVDEELISQTVIFEATGPVIEVDRTDHKQAVSERPTPLLAKPVTSTSDQQRFDAAMDACRALTQLCLDESRDAQTTTSVRQGRAVKLLRSPFFFAGDQAAPAGPLPTRFAESSPQHPE